MKKTILLSTLASLMFAFSGCGPKHVCDEKCSPICQYEFNEKTRKSAEEWKAFKEYKPFTYKATGNVFLDTQLQIYAKLSNQLYSEVIIPYLEADENGTIVMYRAFRDTVEAEMISKNISRKEATTIVAAKIKADNPENYEKIIQSYKVLDNREFTNQLLKFISSIQPELVNLTVVLANGDPSVNYGQLIWVTVQLIPEISRAVEACAFMYDILDAEEESQKQMEEFFKDFDEMSKTSQTTTTNNANGTTSTTDKK